MLPRLSLLPGLAMSPSPLLAFGDIGALNKLTSAIGLASLPVMLLVVLALALALKFAQRRLWRVIWAIAADLLTAISLLWLLFFTQGNLGEDLLQSSLGMMLAMWSALLLHPLALVMSAVLLLRTPAPADAATQGEP